MFLKILEITPTSAVTFRKVPMSHKTIGSYEFIPPTVLSGFLFRLLRIAQMQALPPARAFESDNFEPSNYFILENPAVSSITSVHSLGGYFESTARFSSFRKTGQDVSTLGVTYASDLYPFRATKGSITALLEIANQKGLADEDNEKILNLTRKGHDSRYLKMIEIQLRYFLLTGKRPDMIDTSTFGHKLRPQPMMWEFTISEKFNALLISSARDQLELFDTLQNYGFKIGKEGFAFISEVFRTRKMTSSNGEFVSSTIVPLDPKIKHTEVIDQKNPDSVYYFDWSKKAFVKEIFAMNGSKVHGRYYVDDADQWRIPMATLEKLGVSNA